jgi:hypothetical protein
MYKIIGADGKEYGPISAEVLRQWLDEGRANGQTKVLPEGATEWKTIADVPGLVPPRASAPEVSSVPGPITLAPTPRNNSFAVAGMTLEFSPSRSAYAAAMGFPLASRASFVPASA